MADAGLEWRWIMTWPIIIDGVISDLIQHYLIQFHIEMVDRIKIHSG